MNQRRRDEQEARNAAEVMNWIEHLRREAYINALRAADHGDLAGWVRLFGEAVRDALREGRSRHA